MPIYKTIQDIKNNKLFSGVKEQVLISFFDPKEIREAREGQIIYKTGDESNAIFLIIKGDVRVKFSSNNYVSNRIFNDFFGEKEIVDDTRRISSAVAFSKLVYYRLDRSTFKDLIVKNSTVNNNLKKYGELKLPDVSVDLDRKYEIVDRKKPISFKAFSKEANRKTDERIEEKISPVVTHQIIPDLESIDEILPEDNGSSSDTLNPKQQDKLKSELLEDPGDFKNWQFEETERFIDPLQAAANRKEKEKPVEETKQEKKQSPVIVESGINREVVRRIFAGIDRIFSSIDLNELVKNTNRAIKDLTNSEGVNLILVDEKLSVMQQYSFEGEKTKIDRFNLPEGLTGSCAMQKKVLNFERPTEDSRFNAKIDQPGSARLKRIVFYPIVSDNGETVAVIQIARENKKYTDEEISNLAMMTKQIETAIDRTKSLQELIKVEKQKSGKKLYEKIIDELRVPLTIVNNYAEILSEKELPPEADDIIRMLQKQAHSVEDISETLFTTLIDNIQTSMSDIHFNEFIDDILELLSEYCEARDVKLFKKIGEGAVVSIDRAKFYTAVFQIIKASCDDCRKGGKIYFGTEFSDNMISISIQNEGKGSLTEPEGDINDYFFSQKNFKEDEIKLLLAKKLLLAHSAQLNLSSVKGSGSTFRIILPVIKPETKQS